MDSLTSVLQAVVGELNTKKITFAVGGGLAAAIYRKETRTTQDVDLAIAFQKKLLPLSDLRHIQEGFGYTTTIIREADIFGGPSFKIRDKSSDQVILVGRSKKIEIGLDFLLPNLPWVSKAVLRAQDWRIDFGFGGIPCLTVEDVLLAKFTALTHKEQRFKDLDDIENIFKSDNQIDLSYLVAEMGLLELAVPKILFSKVPEALISVSKDNSKKKKQMR